MPAPTCLTRLFLDFESTDLDFKECGLWEVAVIGTDDTYEHELFRWTTLIRPEDAHFERISQVPAVVSMHAKSGLYGEIVEADRDTLPTVADVETRLIELVAHHAEPGAKVVLAGGGTERFDRRVIDAQMPELANHLDYWCDDLSGPRRVYKQTTGVDILGPVQQEKAHRAMADIEEDLAVARAFRAMYLARANAAPTRPKGLARIFGRKQQNDPADNVLGAIALVEAFDKHQVEDDGVIAAYTEDTAHYVELLLRTSDPDRLIFGLLDVATQLVRRAAATDDTTSSSVLAHYRQQVLAAAAEDLRTS